jgi:hypothetical protein
MQNLATRVLELLSSAPVITAEPGLTVESRISYGVHGDDDELAFSVEWRDAEGCLWAADFSERALAQAEIDGGAVSLRDTDGTKLVFRLHQPIRRINLYSHRRK